jgi:hypothetical protein
LLKAIPMTPPFRHLLILAAMASASSYHAANAQKAKSDAPWNQWIEKDFPFFSATVDARTKASENNLAPRALVFPLGEDHFLAYDIDLLRVAVMWKAREVPFINASMSVNSYPYQLKKVGGGQGALPKPHGDILFQNGIYPVLVCPTSRIRDLSHPPKRKSDEAGLIRS